MFQPQEVTIKEVKWNGEDAVTFHFKEGSSWCGAKRKDFWCPDDNWEEEIKKGALLRLWTVQWSLILGFEVWRGNGWKSVWCALNNFRTKAESKKSEDAYCNFIEEQGKLIAKVIDEGGNLAEINKRIDNGHTGNTFGCALALGIRDAKNRKNAEKVRKEHNGKYNWEGEGVVNPAMLTIGVSK